MDNENKKELEQDEELSALRLAALATLKQCSTQNDNALLTQTDSSQNHIVNSCDNSASNHIPFIQSDRSTHSLATGWRKNGKNNQSARRRLGVFPKSSQRSNLIVINPVSPDENSYSKESAPSLALPQHKWYNSGNEDSMSPKTFRRTGPTRFNRHESDSDDSDSDFEKSDDSASNETVLQDEPSENFSNLAPESTQFEDEIEKHRISEHRLSFDALDSQKNHSEKTTSVYNSLKSHSFESSSNRPDISLRTAQIHNDSEQTWRSNKVSSEDNSKFNLTSPMNEKHQFSKQELHSASSIVNTDYEHQYVKDLESSKLNNIWNYSEVNNDNLYPKDEQYNSCKSSEYQNVEAKRHSLSSVDLRMELKKSMEEYQKNKTIHSNSRKNSCESWVPASIEVDDQNLKHNRNMNQKWQGSASRKSGLNDKHVGKEHLQNNSKNLEQTSANNNNFQIVSFNHKKHSKSPDYWKKSRRPNESQSSDSSHRESSRSPRKHYRISVHQREHSPSTDFNHKRRRQSTDYSHNHSDQGSSYKYKHRSRKSESPQQYRSRTPEHVQRKGKDNSDCTRWKHNKHSEHYRTKYCQKSDSAERKNDSKRDHRTSEDSDTSSSSTECSWRKHSRSREHKRRERSWSNEANQKAECSANELSSSKQLQSESSKQHFRDGKWQVDNLNSSDFLLKNVNEKLDQSKINYLQSTKDKTHKTQLYEDGIFINKTKKTDFSLQQKSSELMHNNNYSNLDQNFQMENKDLGKVTDKVFQEHYRNNQNKYGKHDQSDSNSPLNKYSNNKKFYSRGYKYSNQRNSSRSRSRSSSYSSNSSSNSSSSSPTVRSVSSVIKPVRSENITEIKQDSKHANKKSSPAQKRRNSDVRFTISSEISRDKISVLNENRNHVSENPKRVPVHMRLGTFPRKRVIQMTKDVEAAFVNTSSDDETDVNIKCKKQNLRIVTEMYDSKTKGSCIIERKVEQDSNISRERSRNLKSSHR